MSLGSRIRAWRDYYEWTLDVLDEKSGVDRGTINALENRGSTRSSFGPAIASAFGITYEQLLDESFAPRDMLTPTPLAARESTHLDEITAMWPKLSVWQQQALVNKVREVISGSEAATNAALMSISDLGNEGEAQTTPPYSPVKAASG